MIIGGGPAGLACALTLHAALGKPGVPADLVITVLDAGHTDLQSAELWNVPGIPLGTSGTEHWKTMKSQLGETSVQVISGQAVGVKGEAPTFTVTLESGLNIDANVVVIATGYKHFDLRFEPEVVLLTNLFSPKTRTSLALSAPCLVRPGLYACGNIAGLHSMLSIAMGSGTETACRILSELAGHVMLVHDVPGGHRL